MQPNAAQWDGFARLSRTGEGVLVIFRNASQQPDATITIPMPEGLYRLVSVVTETEIMRVDGAAFRRGVTLALSQNVEIIEIRSAGSKPAAS